MSNQVYSNFAERELYRASDQQIFLTLTGGNQTIPDTDVSQDIGPFPALIVPNANFDYDVTTSRLNFKVEGVYSISLTTAWNIAGQNDGLIAHFMRKNGSNLPRYGFSNSTALIGTDINAPIMSTEMTTTMIPGDYIQFRCYGRCSGTQELQDDSTGAATQFFITKLS